LPCVSGSEKRKWSRMPSVKKRGDTFRIMVSLGYDMKGRQIRKTTTFKSPEGVTPGKAEKLAVAFAHSFEKKCQGMANMNENLRFAELAKWYFEQIAPLKVKETTLNSTKYLIDTYVLPNIGHLKLKDISTARIDELFNQLYTNGRKTVYYLLTDSDSLPKGTWIPTARKAKMGYNTISNALQGKKIYKRSAEKIAAAIGKKTLEVFHEDPSGEKGLEPVSITGIRTALSTIFSTALKKDIIAKNPVTHSTSPKMPQKKKPFLDASQCKQLLGLLNELTNLQMQKAIAALLYTGMRVGELLALHWDAIDFEGGTISIRHTLYRVKGKYKLSTPKTRSSERVISMPPELSELLKEQKRWQDQRRHDVDERWIERNTVFTSEYGEYVNLNFVNATFKRLLRRHDFPPLHIHDLRHANASLLINAGVPVKIISDHLGHSDTKTTENFYAHVFNTTKAMAADAISQALSISTPTEAKNTESGVDAQK